MWLGVSGSGEASGDLIRALFFEDGVARKSALVPIAQLVCHALPRVQWALVGAKRLECGSLLPLCFYAQATCLEPYRHDVQNKVPVPISASAGFLQRLRQPPIGTRGNLGSCRDQGAKPKLRACHLIQLTAKGRTIVTALLTAREADTEKLSTRGVKIFANMNDC